MSTENVASTVLLGMGKGSGIDIIKLARDLTDVEKAPREDKLNTNIEDSEAKISGLAVLKFNVQLLIDAFNGLNDAQELAKPTATSSDTTKVSITAADGSALSGSSDIGVTSLAAAQRNKSNQYTSKTQSLNGGSGFTLTVTPGTGSAKNVSIEAGNDTPQGIVNAINAANAGVSATLLAEDSSGSNYRIMLTGATGASNSYVVTSTLSDSDLGFHDTSNGNTVDNSGTKSLQNPADASLTYNGVSITRSSNSLNDVIPGVTLSLLGIHSGGATTSVNVISDRATLKTKLQDMVTLYNDVKFAMDELSDPDSENEEVGGALAKDLATIRTVRDAIYQAVTQDSSTPSGSITAMRDIGISVMRDGNLSFKESTYDTVAASSFDDISVMLTAGTNNQSRYDGQSQGLATDAVIKLEALTDSISGIFVTRTSSAQTAIKRYQADLEALETRMEAVYQRYLQQFTVMESLVNTLNSTRESMTTTWENMANFGKD
ncbi:MAG: flagellar filament capping protein FliD [Proteobacteria bacterium]|nr:flagellar filament capping protein FliD [Pseudomonadota bacterium]